MISPFRRSTEFPPQYRPNLTRIIACEPGTILNTAPENWVEEAQPGEFRAYRAACLARLACNLCEGINDISAPVTPAKRDHRMYVTQGREYAEWFAKEGRNFQLGHPKKYMPARLQRLQTIADSEVLQGQGMAGTEITPKGLPRIVLGISMPDGDKVQQFSRSDGGLFVVKSAVGFEAVDPASRKAIADLFGCELPPVV